MRHAIYQEFQNILKNYAVNTQYTLNVHCIGGEAVNSKLMLDKDLRFHLITHETDEILIDHASIYQLILGEVLQKLADQQTDIQKSLKNDRITLEPEEQTVYLILWERFRDYLSTIPIKSTDIGMRGCLHRLNYGFELSGRSVYFLTSFLKVLHSHMDILSNMEISIGMLVSDMPNVTIDTMQEELTLLHRKGYLRLNKSNDDIVSVQLTNTFVQAYKKSFEYDYDPSIDRPRGCCCYC